LQEMESMTPTPESLAEVVLFIKKTQTFGFAYPNAIDFVGTWGSGLPRINISTPVAVLLSRLWHTVAKHGNNASSWRVWSFDVLEQLDYPIPQNDDELRSALASSHLVFLHAKKFYPIMRHVAWARKAYWKPTIFNLLWPLLHPLDLDYQVIWCSDEQYMHLMARTSHILWRKYIYVIRGHNWLDKVTLTWPTKVISLKNGILTEFDVQPEDFWFATIAHFDQIAWWDLEQNLSIVRSILDGTCTTAHADLIAANWALALHLLWAVSDLKQWAKLMQQAMSL